MQELPCPLPMAGWIPLPILCGQEGVLALGTRALEVQRLPSAGFSDSRNCHAPFSAATYPVVLRSLVGRDQQFGDLSQTTASKTWFETIRDRVGNAAQAS
jgi:hypothetical protein